MSYSCFASCPKGVELLLEQELQQLGCGQIRQTQAGVYFACEQLKTLYQVCLWSRLASRIFLQVASFTFEDNDQFYQQLKDIDWQQHFTLKDRFVIKSHCKKSIFKNSVYAAQLTKDAYCDYWRDQEGSRPDVDTDFPSAHIHVLVNKNKAEVSIDLVGEGMHKRGYRQDQGGAPLRENLASALLRRAGWPEQFESKQIADLFCGSGTLIIEALWMALNIAPGKFREYWAFESWAQHDFRLWDQVEAEAVEQELTELEGLKAIGNDIDPGVLNIARDNAEKAGVANWITWYQQPAQQLNIQLDGGLIISNPPYGERLQTSDTVLKLHSALGHWLKQNAKGCTLGLYTNDKEYAKVLGIGWNKSYNIPNANIDCQLYLCELKQENFRDVADPNAIPENWQKFIDASSEAFLNRLKKNVKAIKKWAQKEGLEAYRIYDADIPEFAAAIDVYADHLVIQEYRAPKSVDEQQAQRRLNQVKIISAGYLQIPLSKVHLKVRQKQKGKSQYQRESQQDNYFVIQENGVKLQVNLDDFLDTGVFLDSRNIRRYIAEQANGKRFLNLFCYTATASAYAAVAGASKVTSVDLSKTYLNWGGKNLQLNGKVDPYKYQFIAADCLQWLDGADEREGEFDLILLDPPTFSNSKKMLEILDVQKQHGQMIRQCMRLLAKDGELIFVTNFKRFKLDPDIVEHYDVTDICDWSVPKDFQRNKIHQAWIIKKAR